MKHILYFILALFFIKTNGQTRQIQFTSKKIDFGQVREWKNEPAVFNFRNLTKETIHVLPIHNAPDLQVKYPKEPILPGGMGKIEAIYFTDKAEEFLRKFPIYFSHDAVPTQLEIKGKILKLHPEAFIACPNTDAKTSDANLTYTVDIQVVDAVTNYPIKNAQVVFAVRGQELYKYRTNSRGSFAASIKFDEYQLLTEAVNYHNKGEKKVLNRATSFYQIKLEPNRNSSGMIAPVAVQSNHNNTNTQTETIRKTSPPENKSSQQKIEAQKNVDHSGIYREKTPPPVVIVEKQIVHDTVVKQQLVKKTDTLVQREIVRKTDTVIKVQVQKELVYKHDTVVKTNTILQKEIVQKTDTIIQVKKETIIQRDTVLQTKTIVKKDTVLVEKRSVDTVFMQTKMDDSENQALKKQLAEMQQKLKSLDEKIKDQNQKNTTTNSTITSTTTQDKTVEKTKTVTPIKENSKTTETNISVMENTKEVKQVTAPKPKIDTPTKAILAANTSKENINSTTPVTTTTTTITTTTSTTQKQITTTTPVKPIIKDTVKTNIKTTTTVKTISPPSPKPVENATPTKTQEEIKIKAAATPVKNEPTKAAIPIEPKKEMVAEIPNTDIDTKTGNLKTDLFKPNNIVFVVDVSGSMGDGNKLNHMKQSLKELVKVLRPNDRISIITYNMNATIVLPSTSVYDKNTINSIIDSLNAFGITNGVKGLEKAYDFLEKNFIKDGNNQIIMATDGKFTKSETDDQLVGIFVKIKAFNQMRLSVVGFGNDADALRRMKKLADNGKGSMITIENTKQATDKILIDEIKLNSKKN